MAVVITPVSRAVIRRLKALDEKIDATGYTGGRTLDRSGPTPTVVLVTPHAAAQAVIDAHDWSETDDPAAQLKGQAAAAVAANDTFRSIASPTAAQVRDQVRELTRQNTAIIRRLIQLSGA